MPWKKRGKKKDTAAHGGKLMIVLRNRHIVWIDLTPEEWAAKREAIRAGLRDPATTTVTFHDDTVRVEDIVHVKYIGPKASAPTAQPAP